jgi:hypothetical protein
MSLHAHGTPNAGTQTFAQHAPVCSHVDDARRPAAAHHRDGCVSTSSAHGNTTLRTCTAAGHTPVAACAALNAAAARSGHSLCSQAWCQREHERSTHATTAAHRALACVQHQHVAAALYVWRSAARVRLVALGQGSGHAGRRARANGACWLVEGCCCSRPADPLVLLTMDARRSHGTPAWLLRGAVRDADTRGSAQPRALEMPLIPASTPSLRSCCTGGVGSSTSYAPQSVCASLLLPHSCAVRCT